MAIRRRGTDKKPGPELFGELVDVLLEGWGYTARPGHQEGDDPFRIFELTNEDLTAAWWAHREELLAEAKRRGITRPWAMECLEGDEEGRERWR